MSKTSTPISGADTAAKPRRSYALDALRGYAILTMILSELVPRTLPGWMYHAQVPPPYFKFNEQNPPPGITWVDMVFPFFLFSMGVAIPLALSRRIESGVPLWKIIYGVLSRWFLLVGFSIYVGYTFPHVLGYSTVANYFLSILAFALCFAALVRLPNSWKPALKWAIKLVGFAGAAAFVFFIKRTDGTGYDPQKIDIIIEILANVVVTGSLVWLATRKNMLARLGVMGVLMAIRLTEYQAGCWVNWVNNQFNLIPFGLGLGVHQYLFIIIPATIIGDMILEWMKSREKQILERSPWSTGRLVSITLLMFAFVVVMLIGLYQRWLWQTTLAGFGMCFLGWLLTRKPGTTTQKLLTDFYSWGVFCLIMGLIFEPYEGGIKKDGATMSYYFVTAGLAIFMLMAFTIIIDIFGKKRWLQLLIDNGQNPMIAYIGRDTLVASLLGLTYINWLLDKLFVSPWAQFTHSVITVLIIAVVVSVFTRLKIFWRT